MLARARSIGAVVAFCLVAAPLAAQSPLAVVPANSAIVVQLRGWERSLARLNTILKAAAPDFAPKISGQIEAGIAEALMGRELKALGKEGPIFLVFPEVPDKEMDFPEMAIVVRVTNYAQFRDGLLKEEERKELKTAAGYESTKIDGKETFFLNKGEFAVITPSQKALKIFQDKKVAGLAGKLDKSLEAKLLGSDLSVYVDLAAINKKYGKEIADARRELEQALEQAGDLGANLPIAAVKGVYGQLFQLVEDAERVVAAVDFPAEGFSLKVHAQVGAVSKTNLFLAQAKAAPVTNLSKMPGGAMYYLGGTFGSDIARNANLMFMAGPFAGGGGGQVDKAAEEAAKELQSLKIEEWSSSMSVPAANLFVARYQEPAKAAQATLKMYRAIAENGQLAGLPIKGKPEIKADAEKLGGFTLHHLKAVWDFDKIFEQLPEEARDQVREMMSKLLGKEQQLWFGTDGRSFVEVSAKDWGAAKALLEGYLSGKQSVGAAAGWTSTRKQLPERAALVGGMDLAKYVQSMFTALSGMFQNLPGVGDKKLNAAEGPANYLGYAVGLEPRNLTLDLWLPAAGVQQVIKMLAPFLEGLDR